MFRRKFLPSAAFAAGGSLKHLLNTRSGPERNYQTLTHTISSFASKCGHRTKWSNSEFGGVAASAFQNCRRTTALGFCGVANKAIVNSPGCRRDSVPGPRQIPPRPRGGGSNSKKRRSGNTVCSTSEHSARPPGPSAQTPRCPPRTSESRGVRCYRKGAGSSLGALEKPCPQRPR